MAVKNSKLLSFGEDEDEDEEDPSNRVAGTFSRRIRCPICYYVVEPFFFSCEIHSEDEEHS